MSKLPLSTHYALKLTKRVYVSSMRNMFPNVPKCSLPCLKEVPFNILKVRIVWITRIIIGVSLIVRASVRGIHIRVIKGFYFHWLRVHINFSFYVNGYIGSLRGNWASGALGCKGAIVKFCSDVWSVGYCQILHVWIKAIVKFCFDVWGRGLLSSSALLFKVGRLSSSALMFKVGRLLSSSALMVGWSWGATGVLGFWGGQGVIVFNKRGNILRVGTSHKKF